MEHTGGSIWFLRLIVIVIWDIRPLVFLPILQKGQHTQDGEGVMLQPWPRSWIRPARELIPFVSDRVLPTAIARR